MRILLMLLVLLLASCTERNIRTTVNYDEVTDSLSVESQFADTTKIMMASLPLVFDSTDVVLHPSGLIDIDEMKKHSFKELKLDVASSVLSKSRDYKSINRNFYAKFADRNTISGVINNIYFDDLISGQQRLLTENRILITSITYLRSINKKTGKGYLLYTVHDKDTDRDGLLTTNDLESLYISNLDGTEFVRLTKENEALNQIIFVDAANRYYFSSIEDINRDGIFNREDKFHFYYLDFSADGYKLIEYDPISG